MRASLRGVLRRARAGRVPRDRETFMFQRLTLAAAVLVAATGCVYVNTLPEAKTKLPQLREQFDRFCERSQPSSAVEREEWETARRAFVAEMRSLQHDL